MWEHNLKKSERKTKFRTVAPDVGLLQLWFRFEDTVAISRKVAFVAIGTIVSDVARGDMMFIR